MEKIFGRTQGLKPSQKKRLSHLYNRKIPPGHLLSAELARTLAELSQELNRPLSLLFDRRGRIAQVGVGDARELPIPPGPSVETRLSGWRLLHTHLHPGGLSQPDLSCLFLHRLDALAALEVRDGQPASLHLAQLSPPGAVEEDWRIWPARPYFEYLDWDLEGAVRALEEELSRQARALSLQDGTGERALLVGIDQGQGPEAELELAELAELARTAGASVVSSQLIFRPVLDPRFVIGKGKLDELLSIAYHKNAGTLIFNLELTPTQARELEAATSLKVLDRTQLILDIFAQHARTPEAQVQVELAQLRYLLPRLIGQGRSLSRLGGGIGTRGPGESKLEMDRRRLQARISYLSERLSALSHRRLESRKRRERSGLPIIGVVGYTNAGKTSLMHALAPGGEEGEDKLFATLRPLTRKGFLKGVGALLYTDTVGFIRKMPEDLLEAFRSTLEELREADLLLHVLDASTEGALERHRIVEELLRELEIEAPRLLVLNKIDVADPYEVQFLRERLGGLPTSARRQIGLEELKGEVARALQGHIQPPAWALSKSGSL